MRDTLSAKSNQRRDQSIHEARGFFFRFEQNRIAVIPSVYNRDAHGIGAAAP